LEASQRVPPGNPIPQASQNGGAAARIGRISLDQAEELSANYWECVNLLRPGMARPMRPAKRILNLAMVEAPIFSPFPGKVFHAGPSVVMD
jgi:hypothetical protein